MNKIQKPSDSFFGLKDGTAIFKTRKLSTNPDPNPAKWILSYNVSIANSNSTMMELHSEQNNVIAVKMMEQVGIDGKKEMVVELHVDKGDSCLLGPRNNVAYSSGIYDKPLSCFGCGIGWFSFVLGFAFPPLWYYATVLYFGKYYLKDPRERSGLAASAIAAMICSVAALVSLLAVFL